MNTEKKYRQVFKEYIASDKVRNPAIALGLTSNLDVLCDFDINLFNTLSETYLKTARLDQLKAADRITTMEEFVETVAFYGIRGIGGEVDVADFDLIRDLFPCRYGMGGTGAQGALALSAIGYPCVLHLTDCSPEVCDILDTPYIYSVSDEGKLIHTNGIISESDQEIHYIIQFKKGDHILIGKEQVSIPVSNRIILTNITVNAKVPLWQPYFNYLEKYAASIHSNVISSFNGILEKDILLKRLDYIKAHINMYREANSKGIVYFEDAHYHSEEIHKLCLETLCPHVDIYSLNEEELTHILEIYGQSVNIEDIISCIQGATAIWKRFNLRKGVIIHTKDYAMYVGERLEADMESGLMLGNLLAAAKAANGRYGTKEDVQKLLELPLSDKGVSWCDIAEREKFQHDVIIIPSKYMDKPPYTIGLGDSFTAGVQMCFIQKE